MHNRARPAASGGSGLAAADAAGGGDDGREGSSDWPEFRIESSAVVPVLAIAGLAGIAWRGIRQLLLLYSLTVQVLEGP